MLLRHIKRGITHTTSLAFTEGNCLKIPTFRCIDEEGKPLQGCEDYVNALSKETLHEMFKTMIQVREFDTIYYDLQRQGVISFYMQNSGEEGLQVGSAAALHDKDWVFPQYRELGVFLWRGFGIQQASHQLFGNSKDLGEGKQMPVHYGSKELHLQTVSSPLSTQMPQASGLGYGLRLREEPLIAVTYFGEGAASEGDAHAAFNFAATLKSQTLFICRNNKYAISTGLKDQFAGDGIAVRGVGYGMPALRCDGNDVFAMYNATKTARERILQNKEPVLLESMTYRRGHHSTSDDSTKYRKTEEIQYYLNVDNPIIRLEKFLKNMNWLEFTAEEYSAETRKYVLETKDAAANTKWANWRVMFTNVYDEPTANLEKQQSQLAEHLEIYGDMYDLDLHEE